MTTWSLEKIQESRKLIDLVRGLTVSVMCDLRRQIAAPTGRRIGEVLAQREGAAFWSEQKAAQSRLARHLMETSRLFDPGEARRTSSRIVTAMDEEARRLCRLDEHGAFDPDALDPQSQRLLDFYRKRLGQSRQEVASRADVGAPPVPDDAAGEKAAEFALQWVRGSAVFAMCCYRRDLVDYRGQPIRQALAHPQVAEQWAAFRMSECGRWGAALANTVTEAGRFGASLALVMLAEAERILVLDDAGEFDPDSLDPQSQALMDFVQAQMATQAA